MVSRLDAAPYALGLLESLAQGVQTRRANRETEERYQESKGLLKGLARETLPQVQQLSTNLQQGYGDVYNWGMGQLEGLGEQSRRDIELGARATKSTAIEGLNARGLGNTTTRVSALRGVNADRTAALNRLEDQLAQNRLQWGTALRGNQLQAQERLGLLPINTQAELTNRLVNLISSREDIAPSLAAFTNTMSGLGRASYPAPSAPTDNSWIGQVGGQTIGSAGMIGAVKILVKTCIDGDAVVVRTSPDGEAVPTALKDVEVGDFVLGDDKQYHKVVQRDYGAPHPERGDDFINIHTTSGDLTLTRDHPVGGKRADEWQPGQRMKTRYDAEAVVEQAIQVAPVACGDLQLEGGHAYYANGLIVSSMFDILEDGADVVHD